MNVLDRGFVQLVAKTGHAGLATTNAARLSYGKQVSEFKDDDRKLIAYLLGNGHTSPFRHAYFTFHVKAPLFVFRQWWKYQVGSTWREYETADGDPVGMPGKCGCYGQGWYVNIRGERAECNCSIRAIDIQISTDAGCSWNEISGRYKVLEPEFYLPDVIRKNTGRQAANENLDEEASKNARVYMYQVYGDCKHAYEMLLEQGVAKELARLVLPPSIYSECVWTVSLQAVLHFLDQRLKPDAQFEIRAYAQAIMELIRGDLDEMGISP